MISTCSSILSFAFDIFVWILTVVVLSVYWCIYSCLSAYEYWQQEPADGSGAGDTTSTERGLNPSEIEGFPKFGYQPEAEGIKRGCNKITECVVCLGEFQVGETLRLIPMCGHVFHAACVDVWLLSNATCPYCRASVGPPPAGKILPEVLIVVDLPPPLEPVLL